MNYLLDSNAFVDISVGHKNLKPKARKIFEDPESQIFISVASIWELGLKRSLGKIEFDVKGAADLLAENGIQVLEITLPVTLQVNELPYHHKDPFDRIIIATAQIHDCIIMTSDDEFNFYEVETIKSR